ncbi:MAG: nitroreductase family protein [Sphaerobacter sp.]|nr:nitroreductase family protein [Sphaerobacter sp.]
MVESSQADRGARPAELEAIIRGRRSVRRFRPDPVPRDAVERILEAGRWAPSPHGSQPWRFAVLTRPEIKARLAEAMAEAWLHNLAMDGEPEEIIAKRLAGSRRRLLEAPVLILLCLYLGDLDRYPDPERQAAETTMAIQSLGCAAQNMLLMAYSLGLDGGWMCAPLFCPDVARAALGLPETVIPHALLTIGYAAADPRRRERRPLAELIVKDA